VDRQTGRTMLDKIWDQHVIARISDDTDLLHVDRHLLHDLGGSRGLLDLRSRGLAVHSPELTFATPDHAISTGPARTGTIKTGQELLAALRTETAASRIRMFDVGEPGQGIVHVIGPELGLSLPGCLIVCGDSHTCTHGGLGAVAFGIGSSELTHVFATQALIQRRPKAMRVNFEGKPGYGVTAKDLIMFSDAGFEWREPGCSMCLAANGETVGPGQRSVSTSNRNFVGRQGPRARTHLASPASAAAAAIAGVIVDVRTMRP